MTTIQDRPRANGRSLRSEISEITDAGHAPAT